MKNTPLISSKKLIPVKYILIYKLREEGRKYKEIGLVMNVTEAYACMIYKRAKFLLNSSDWDDGLTLRARKCLKRLGINSKEDAMTAYTNGKLYFKEGKGCVRNTQRGSAMAGPTRTKTKPRKNQKLPSLRGIILKNEYDWRR